MDWIEEFIHKSMNQSVFESRGTASRSVVPGRVLRTREAPGGNKAYDVVILTASGQEINLNPDPEGRPLRPFVRYVLASGDSDFSVDAKVSVQIERFGSKPRRVVETGSGSEDYVEAVSGRCTIVASSGGGSGCGVLPSEIGVYFG